jgi:hypothetical protein
MNELDLAWLAGFLEGEGCFHFSSRNLAKGYIGSPCVSVYSVDEDVIVRAARLIGSPVRRVIRRTVTGKKIFGTSCAGQRAIELMATLKPRMGARRAAKIDEVLSCAAARPGQARGSRCGQTSLTEADVISIRREALTGKRGIQTRLARRYKISQAAIWSIIAGRSWKHVA